MNPHCFAAASHTPRRRYWGRPRTRRRACSDGGVRLDRRLIDRLGLIGAVAAAAARPGDLAEVIAREVGGERRPADGDDPGRRGRIIRAVGRAVVPAGREERDALVPGRSLEMRVERGLGGRLAEAPAHRTATTPGVLRATSTARHEATQRLGAGPRRPGCRRPARSRAPTRRPASPRRPTRRWSSCRPG